MKKVLILGAAGNIGTYLVDYFYDRKEEYGLELITADLSSNKFIEEHSKFYKFDIRERDTFEALPENIYAVIDLATTMPARMLGFHPESYVRTNIDGTVNVLEFCREKNIDRLLFAQTFGDILKHAEVDPVLKISMIPEQDYADNKSVYITTMNTAVELIKCYNAIYDQRTFIFRLPTIYSWSNKKYFEDGKEVEKSWRILVDQALNGKDIHVWGDPNRAKDMPYVKDLCQMFFKACFVDKKFGFYNVGTGKGIKLIDQIKGYIKVFGGSKKSNILYSPERRNAPQYIMDITEAKQELGYEPKYDFISMLEDMKKEKELDRLDL